MPTYTIEPLAAVSPSVPGQISLDGSTETGADAGIYFDEPTQRVFFPEEIELYGITFELTFAPQFSGSTVTTSESGIRLQKIDTTLDFNHLASLLAGITGFEHVAADDAGLHLGSFPYPTPEDGAFLYLEYDYAQPITITGGLLTVDWRPSTPRWWAGVAGSG